MKKTDQQTTIFQGVVEHGESIAVSAGAGTGKTFLARLIAAELASNGKSIEEIPFNRSVREKANAYWKGKNLDGKINAQTVHSRGIKMLYGSKVVKGRANTNEGATSKLGQIVSQIEGEKAEKHRADIIALAEKMRVEGCLIPSLADVAMSPDEIASKYQLCLDKATGSIDPDLVECAIQAVKTSDEQTEGFDYTDMIRLPIVYGLKRFLPETTLVVLDEVQDYNVLMFGFLRECLVPSSCQVFMIGDYRCQALMQFSGARPDLFEVIADHYGCRRERLSVNFRCSQAVINYANTSLPEDIRLTHHDGAPVGSVDTGSLDQVIEDIESGVTGNGSAILCKTNAPLIAMGVRLIVKDIPFQIRMEKLAKPILGLIWKLNGYKDKLLFGNFKTGKLEVPVGEMAIKMRQTAEKMASEAGAVEGTVLTPEEDDILKCIQALEIAASAKGITTLGKVPYGTKGYFGHPIFQILKIMTDGSEGITLSTGHIAKGLEWDTVYILPSKTRETKTEWERDQDFCLTHVMQTRAIDRMVMLASEDDDGEIESHQV